MHKVSLSYQAMHMVWLLCASVCLSVHLSVAVIREGGDSALTVRSYRTGARTLYLPLSQWDLLDPTKLACDLCCEKASF